jgi:hypothetical protein
MTDVCSLTKQSDSIRMEESAGGKLLEDDEYDIKCKSHWYNRFRRLHVLAYTRF